MVSKTKTAVSRTSRKRFVAWILAALMAFGGLGVMPSQVLAAQTEQSHEMPEFEDIVLNRPEERFNRADLSSLMILDDELTRTAISEDERLRILSQVWDTSGSVGLQGFDDDFDANPDEIIEIIVQFVTPPVGVLRHMPQGRNARANPEIEALAAHAAFAQQLGGIIVPFGMSDPVIEVTGAMHVLFNGVFMRVTAGIAAQIAALPEVFAVTPNAEIFSHDVVVDDGILHTSGLEPASTFDPPNTGDFMAAAIDALGMDYIHNDLGRTGNGIIVAVIDTGIDYNHPRLTDRFIGGWDFVDDDNDPMETTYRDWVASGQPMIDNRGARFITMHGTHVAGTVIAIAPDAQILAYRALGPYGRGTVANGMRAIERAFEDGAHITNMSLGAAINRPFDPMNYITNVASLNGMLMVTSAGNTGQQGMFSVGMPGVASLAVTVGAARYGGFGAHGYPAAVTNGSTFEVAILGWGPGDSFLDNSLNGNVALTQDQDGFFSYVRVGGGSADDFAAVGDLTGRIAVVNRVGNPLSTTLDLAIAANAGALIFINNQGPTRMQQVIVQEERPQNLIPILTVNQLNDYQFSNEGRLRLNEFSSRLPANRNMGPFSSHGPTLGTFHIKPDIVAPGVNIVSAVPNFYTNPDHSDVGGWYTAYLMVSGTSMAAPAIAGVAALLLEVFPSASPEEIKARMMNTASLANLAYGNYTVYTVGAGFVDPLAAITQTSFALVETYIPWLGTGVGWSPNAMTETWRRAPMSSLNFGTVTDMTTMRSEPLRVEFSHGGIWAVEIIHNENNFADHALGVLTYTRENYDIIFTLQFDDTHQLSRVHEGYVIFTSGDYRISKPWAGFFGDGQPNPIARPGMGILRPMLTSLGDETIVAAPVHAAFSGALIGFNDPLGTAVSFRFFAHPIYGPAFDAGHVFYYGQITIPANTDVAVPRAVSSWGYNLATGEEDALLPEGVYELRIEPLDENGIATDTWIIGRFVISNQQPTVEFFHYHYPDTDDINYPYVYAVIYSEGQSIISVNGRVFSPGHAMAELHNITTPLYRDDAGNPIVYGHEFSMVVLGGVRVGIFADADGHFTVPVPFERLAPFAAFGDARLVGNHAVEGTSLDFIRIPVGTIGNIDMESHVGGIRTEFATIIYMLEEELMSAVWDEYALVVGLDRLTPGFDIDAFDFELVIDGGAPQLIAPAGFTIDRGTAAIRFNFAEIAWGIGQDPLTSISPIIIAPVAAESPQTFIPNTGLFVGDIEWYPVHNLFHFSTVYTATVTLWASGGSPFAQDIIVNIPDAVISNLNVREDGLTLTFDVEFEATETLEQGYALVVMRVDNPTGAPAGPFGNFNDQAMMFDSTATMVPLIERMLAGAEATPPDFWQMWDIQMPYYYWDNPTGGFVYGEASLMLPAGLYDWVWTSNRTRNLSGFDTVVVRAGYVHYFDLWIDWNAMTMGISTSVYPMTGEVHVSSANSRRDTISNQGGATTITFRGLMPTTDVAVYQGGSRITAPWATTDVHVHGSPHRYDVTINFPANSTGAPIVYEVVMLDTDGGRLGNAFAITVSDQYIARPGYATIIVDIRDPNPVEPFQFLVDSTATANGSIVYDDYDIFLPYFLEDNRHAVLVQGVHTMQLEAGVYDIMVANYWSNRILEYTYWDDIVISAGHTYRFVVPRWSHRYRLYVDDILAPFGRMPLQLPLPVVGQPVPQSVAPHEAFSINFVWYPNHAYFQMDTLYRMDVVLEGNPGMFLGDITHIDVPGSAGPVQNLQIGSCAITFTAYFPQTDIPDEPGLVRVTLVTPEDSMWIRLYDVGGYVMVFDVTATIFPMPGGQISTVTGLPFWIPVRNAAAQNAHMQVPDGAIGANPLVDPGNFVPLNGRRSIFVQPDQVFDVTVMGRAQSGLWPRQDGSGGVGSWAFASPVYGILDNVAFEYGYRYEIEMHPGVQQELVVRKFRLSDGVQVPFDRTPRPQPDLGTPVPTSVDVTPASVTLQSGGTQTFVATVNSQLNIPMPDETVTWSLTGGTGATAISSAGVLTIDTAQADGQITVTATVDSTPALSGNAAVTVVAPVRVPTTITINPTTADVLQGGTQNFTAIVYDQHGIDMTDVGLEWSLSGNTTATTISQSGELAVDADEPVGDITVTVAVADEASVYATAVVTVLPDGGGGPTEYATIIILQSNPPMGMFGVGGYQLMINTQANTFPLYPHSWNILRSHTADFDIMHPTSGYMPIVAGENNFEIGRITTVPTGVPLDVASIAVGAGGGAPNVPAPELLDQPQTAGLLYSMFSNLVFSSGGTYTLTINAGGVNPSTWYPVPQSITGDWVPTTDLAPPPPPPPIGSIIAVETNVHTLPMGGEITILADGQIVGLDDDYGHDYEETRAREREAARIELSEEPFAFTMVRSNNVVAPVGLGVAALAQGTTARLYVTLHGNTLSVEIEIVEPPLASVTFGANITAAIDNETIISGAEVLAGTAVVFTAQPPIGYRVASWVVNGTTIVGDDATAISITRNLPGVGLHVTVTFQPIMAVVPRYAVTFGEGITATAGGTAIASGALVEIGTAVVFTAVAPTGQRIAHWTVNGHQVGATATLVRAVPVGGLTVAVAFEDAPQEPSPEAPSEPYFPTAPAPITQPTTPTPPEIPTPAVAAPVATPIPIPAAELFDDINSADWFHDYATIAVHHGLFQGMSYRIFAPNADMTRAMVVQVLANLADVDLSDFADGVPTFDDVAATSWYFAAIEWAAAYGIVMGVGDGQFAPSAPVTREQIATMIYRFVAMADVYLPQGTVTDFADQASISAWAVDAVAVMQAAGIIEGRPDGSFDPAALASRAEVAAIFARLVQLIG